jgi:multiple sugar transport system substrate-binding protein
MRLPLTVGIVGIALSFAATSVGAQPITVQYVDWKLNDSQEILEFYRTAAAEFEAANPDVKIELVPVQWEQRVQKFTTEVQAGLPRDAVRLSKDDLPALFPILQPLEPLLETAGATDLVDAFPIKVLESLSNDGQLYAIPQSIAVDGLMYNKRMFEEAGLDPNKPPATWEEFRAYAEKLTKAPEQYAYAIFGAKSGSSARRWLRVFWDAGCEFISRDFKRAAFLDKDECIEAFAREINFAIVDGFTPPGATTADFEFVITAFAQRRVAMHMGGPNNAAIAEARNPGIFDELALAPMPDTGASLVGGDAMVIPAGAKHPVEAMRWIAFINSKELQVRSSLVLNATPSRPDALSDERIQAKPLLAFSPEPDALFAGYNTPKWPEIQEALFDIVQSALLEDETPEQALRSGAERIDAILAE